VEVPSKFGIYTVKMHMKTRKSGNMEMYIGENCARSRSNMWDVRKFIKFWIKIVMNIDD